jgi:hypothetical protein
MLKKSLRFVVVSGRGVQETIQCLLQRMLTFPDFVVWWNKPRVLARYFRKEIDHPDVGLRVLEQTVHQVLTCRNFYMVLLTPLPESETEKKLGMLLTLRTKRQEDRLRSASHSNAGEAVSEEVSTSGVAQRTTPAAP